MGLSDPDVRSFIWPYLSFNSSICQIFKTNQIFKAIKSAEIKHFLHICLFKWMSGYPYQEVTSCLINMLSFFPDSCFY